MAKHYLSCILVVFVIIVFPVYHLIAQEEDKLDKVSDDVIQSVYHEEPETVSNDTTDQKKRSSFNAYPYAYYTPESKFAVGAAWNYEDYNDPVITDRNSAEAFAALEYMIFNLGFTLNYDNQPAEGATENDYVFQTTIGWEL